MKLTSNQNSYGAMLEPTKRDYQKISKFLCCKRKVQTTKQVHNFYPAGHKLTLPYQLYILMLLAHIVLVKARHMYYFLTAAVA